MKTRPVACAVLLFVLLTAFSPLPASGWHDEGVVEPVPLPVWESQTLTDGALVHRLGAPALALDPAGRPHIVFGSNTLFHTFFDGAGWQRERVAELRSTESLAALAIDGAGRIFIAALDDGRPTLYARQPGGIWQAMPLPLPAGMVEVTIALGDDGWPVVLAAFGSSQEKPLFYVARQGPAGWSAEAVATESPASDGSQLAIDGTGQPVVAYSQFDLTEIWLARRTAAGWRHERVATGCVLLNKSLAVDAAGMAHVAYSDNCDHQLTYTREGANGWVSLPVADDGLAPSLALDAAGQPRIAYKDAEGGQMYAERRGAVWDLYQVQAGEDAGWYNTLVLDAAGTPHIASVKDDLYYATNPGGGWQVTQVADNRWAGRTNALALFADGTPVVVYSVQPAGELWWGTGQGDAWTTGFLADVEPGDVEVAVAVDGQDTAYIAYADRVANKLVAGRRQGDTWLMETIGPGGYGLSLAIGSDDRPQLILTVGQGIVYWTREKGKWVSEPVGGLSVGMYGAHLALDSQNRPHVAGSRDDGVWHAVRLSPGNWSVEPLMFENILGLAIGPNDRLYVLHLFVEYWNKHLPFALVSLLLAVQVDEDTWDDYVLGGGIDWSMINPTIVVSADQRAHAAFTDPGWGASYYWVDAGGAWGSETAGWPSAGDVSLAVGSDGQPRLLTSDFSDLVLQTRRIIWLDQASFLPVVPR